MKTEHELLKEICEKIGYDLWFLKWDINEKYLETTLQWNIVWRIIDVREIIFTQEFMDKYWDWLCKIIDPEWQEPFETTLIFNHLDNPTKYLADLLNIK